MAIRSGWGSSLQEVGPYTFITGWGNSGSWGTTRYQIQVCEDGSPVKSFGTDSESALSMIEKDAAYYMDRLKRDNPGKEYSLIKGKNVR